MVGPFNGHLTLLPPFSSHLPPMVAGGFAARPLSFISLLPCRRIVRRRFPPIILTPTPTCRIMASHSPPPPSVAVAGDPLYGGKQVISVTPQLYEYILANTNEPQVMRELREETASMPGSQMQVSPDQAQLLAMLVQILGAERCIEVGTYMGYSSLAIALALPKTGHLVACERDAKCLEVAKKYYEKAGVLHKVHVQHGLAADTLKTLISNGKLGWYDFAFVDAEKKKYSEYFELLMKLIRVGGIIVMDNVLWHGKVADPLINDSKTVSIRDFNRSVLGDPRVSISMVPIGDGMTICRKN